MPERIVDALEAVQIEEQQRHLFVVTRSQRYREIEAVQQQVAIGQAGQLVVIREAPGLLHRFRQERIFLLEQRTPTLKSIELPQCCAEP